MSDYVLSRLRALKSVEDEPEVQRRLHVLAWLSALMRLWVGGTSNRKLREEPSRGGLKGLARFLRLPVGFRASQQFSFLGYVEVVYSEAAEVQQPERLKGLDFAVEFPISIRLSFSPTYLDCGVLRQLS